MASQQGLRKALGSIKDSTKIGLAKVNSTYKVGAAGAWIFPGGTGRVPSGGADDGAIKSGGRVRG